MRLALATFSALIVLVGCVSTKAEVDSAVEGWRQRISSGIPLGTDVSNARQWFEKQGLKPLVPALTRPNEAKDLEVSLESIPAREWYCSKWMVTALVRVSPEGKVARHEVRALGQCL